MKSAKQIVEEWLVHFNRGDADALADLYHQDAVNHQVANLPIQGKQAIRELFAYEFSTAEMICEPVQMFESGEWVIMEWKDPLGLLGSGFFHIQDGKIRLQRGYWDKLSFLRMHGMPLPTQ
ncbi:nuclear transport factor 2 family protein [Neolewinella litorea]|uniref:Nuclear transport factor 2 family protein n=1 Tax=Neolewinella litorea TaxID=2562452 RepID=A0A4S4NS26_9BACT|nr:nuclear transport factor 2 family protein [Neolewinella litorea]THH41208.1 nuclear transport factor 2 family protein [Neolewinella litorea]